MELTPDFSIVINGDKTFPKDRVLSIRTTDETGIVSDSCEIELDDFDDALQMPNTEAKVEVALGYKESGLTKIGTYYVKEIAIDGATKTVRLKCNAAPKSMRSQKTKNNDSSLGEFSSVMAFDLGFASAVNDELTISKLADSLQFAESDMSYLTRITRKLGAIAKPVDGHLVIANEGSGKSVSGKNLPTKYIEASDVANYSCHFRETGSESSSGTVYANWYDKNSGEYHLEKVGSGSPETEIQEIFATRDQAITAAQAKLKRTAKTNKTFSLSTSGRPDLFAESPLMLQGFSKKIPKSWIIKRVEHVLSSAGFRTNVECYQGG